MYDLGVFLFLLCVLCVLRFFVLCIHSVLLLFNCPLSVCALSCFLAHPLCTVCVEYLLLCLVCSLHCVVALFSECVCVVSLFSVHAAVYSCHVSFSDFSHVHTILCRVVSLYSVCTMLCCFFVECAYYTVLCCFFVLCAYSTGLSCHVFFVLCAYYTVLSCFFVLCAYYTVVTLLLCLVCVQVSREATTSLRCSTCRSCPSGCRRTTLSTFSACRTTASCPSTCAAFSVMLTWSCTSHLALWCSDDLSHSWCFLLDVHMVVNWLSNVETCRR